METPRPASGNATGGNGGNASAQGGNANASNDAQVGQVNESRAPATPGAAGKFCCHQNSGSKQENESTIHQGDNDATGGNANATGGNGGNADTGNTQEGNSNALANRQVRWAPRVHPGRRESRAGGFKLPFGGSTGRGGQGGNTSASSGNATGGNGGNASATAATPTPRTTPRSAR